MIWKLWNVKTNRGTFAIFGEEKDIRAHLNSLRYKVKGMEYVKFVRTSDDLA